MKALGTGHRRLPARTTSRWCGSVGTGRLRGAAVAPARRPRRRAGRGSGGAPLARLADPHRGAGPRGGAGRGGPARGRLRGGRRAPGASPSPRCGRPTPPRWQSVDESVLVRRAGDAVAPRGARDARRRLRTAGRRGRRQGQQRQRRPGRGRRAGPAGRPSSGCSTRAALPARRGLRPGDRRRLRHRLRRLLRGPGRGPRASRVLAVDIPSGVQGDTGEAVRTRRSAAERTVTFAALKPGLLHGRRAVRSGRRGAGRRHRRRRRRSASRRWSRTPTWPRCRRRAADAHKWASAVAVVAGSPGMEGAAVLCARGASRAGAGMVRLGGARGGTRRPGRGPPRRSGCRSADEGWADDVLASCDRCRALVIGPGLGRVPTRRSRASVG